MLPYANGTAVIIDPTIHPKKFTFGEVPVKLFTKIGIVKEKKYVHGAIKRDCYGVQFEGHKDLVWFKETEIV